MSLQYAQMRILIVEDQRPFLLLLRGLINNLGAKDVVIAAHADQALAACRKEKFDIIICDLHLGNNRKNGFELIEELRIKKRVKPSTVFILISADSARPIVLGSVERRPDEYLIKPFSQAQLKNRLQRAWDKRQFLLPVYGALANKDFIGAKNAALKCLENAGVYQRYATQLLVEIYWQLEQVDEALTLLKNDQEAMPAQWTQLALAQTYLLKKDHNKALKTAQNLLIANRFHPDAYDVLAQCHSAMNDSEAALKDIQEALKLSPLSLNRHFTASKIARDNNDYPLLIDSNLAIWNLSRHTVHKNLAHWCNYIGSILDAAQAAEDKKARNRYQQEALLLIQRSQFDDVLAKSSIDFDLDIFSQVINARVSLLDGKLMDAKRDLMESQLEISQKFECYPRGMVPDSLKIMLDLGEFEEANDLTQRLKREDAELDPNSQYLVSLLKKEATELEQKYSQFNKRGITLYQQGKFERAKAAFEQAFDLAPVNVGIALNLLQCLMKLLGMTEQPSDSLIKECQQVYRVVKGAPMRSHHQKKHDDLINELHHYRIIS